MSRSAAADEETAVLLFFASISMKVLVPGNIKNAFLDSLVPDTPYSVNVTALYADGDGPSVRGNGKTCEYRSS